MVEVAVAFDCHDYRISKRAIEGIVALVLAKEGISRGKISCVFVGDASIKKINTAYLGHRFSTDVITFLIETRPSLEAEIYINLKQARRQARQYRVSMKNELTRLVVHGVLHALGYDDKRTKQRKKMFEVQERYVELCPRVVSGI
ncbi:MAG TPA: rRNA maturation RNase YbeY [Bacteroidota bacterium]|nr:rRNA maturation RNase YbeY [Bacteroidota bacterium]